MLALEAAAPWRQRLASTPAQRVHSLTHLFYPPRPTDIAVFAVRVYISLAGWPQGRMALYRKPAVNGKDLPSDKLGGVAGQEQHGV